MTSSEKMLTSATKIGIILFLAYDTITAKFHNDMVSGSKKLWKGVESALPALPVFQRPKKVKYINCILKYIYVN